MEMHEHKHGHGHEETAEDAVEEDKVRGDPSASTHILGTPEKVPHTVTNEVPSFPFLHLCLIISHS